ncbi:MAG: PIN domain nuclease [Actinomycetota bacterium]|nr:PIN domain nuclease [Acidimicrobiia bacterium]MDQ3304424.1 PIN domain nuclease [Actinomycetota bacterium]
MGLVLDTGALIAFDRGSREVAALVEATRRRREKVVTSSGCVAQAWRGGGPRQALLARLLRGVGEAALDPEVSPVVGELCDQAASSDVIDAHVALLARDEDMVVTSDADDIRTLLRARGSVASVVRC